MLKIPFCNKNKETRKTTIFGRAKFNETNINIATTISRIEATSNDMRNKIPFTRR